MALIDMFLSRAVKRGQLTLHRPGKAPATFGTPDPAFGHITIRFADSGVAGRIIRNPALAAGEMYMDGRLTVDGDDIMGLVKLMTGNSPWERGQNALQPSAFVRGLGAVKHRLDRINMERRSKQNVAHHYDLSARLYDLFLDADKQYSCAYYTDPDNSLEQAQSDKLAHIAAKLALRPGMRVLDIGCGWGGMALYLNRHFGVEVLGVTLSEEQLKIARERAAAAGVADKVKFELIDYRRVEGRFDRIVSVGMFEHVGQAQFDEFFRACGTLLSVDGVMLVHTIGRMGPPGSTDAFTRKYIFPGGYIPALSETVAASEKCRLIATDVETWRLHYAHTLRAWYERCEEHRDAIIGMYDERFYRMWTFYLAGAAAAFESGAMCNYQIQYARHRHALPYARDYMGEAEKRLHREA